MTDRHLGYLVTLDAAAHAEDSAHLLALIARMRGVSSVKPVVQDMHSEIAYERALRDLRTKIAAVLWDTPK
jgi:hypothetical protein